MRKRSSDENCGGLWFPHGLDSAHSSQELHALRRAFLKQNITTSDLMTKRSGHVGTAPQVSYFTEECDQPGFDSAPGHLTIPSVNTKISG